MEKKKPSFRISEEQLTQTNLGKLSLPEYFVYKTQTPQQSTRALTLPDVLTLTSRSILTSRGPRTQVKSIANPVGSVSILYRVFIWAFYLSKLVSLKNQGTSRQLKTLQNSGPRQQALIFQECL